MNSGINITFCHLWGKAAFIIVNEWSWTENRWIALCNTRWKDVFKTPPSRFNVIRYAYFFTTVLIEKLLKSSVIEVLARAAQSCHQCWQEGRFGLLRTPIKEIGFFDSSSVPVCWGCRIHWLHICRGVKISQQVF